ncbi:DUF3301 domain-containing protein [Fulvimonas soli]|jgi:hypothetical protein|uniref:Uncharacterized protein DUF3301 n=1 Tax=Fulvimonas soli TaxID=155197 RepID=A0A316IIB0_9GAMM|nr:DUF3301 domain-containing protein [Fulvimonas soli]PWK92194.1 uncharacterized protein DUF3301 [Fulvimonas soli]TNY27913.1 hypothetical protein BV497_01355 [Fulvimonas soli]
MGQWTDLSLLLALGAVIAPWLGLSRARERATEEVRRQCVRHGLQLLDETVGLRAVRLRRLGGRLRLERCYGFEVSIDGDDRESGQLWMAGRGMSGLSLPTVHLETLDDRPAGHGLPDNVVPLRPRSGQRSLH